MAIIDDRTPNLDLPLPNVANVQTDDVARMRTALSAIDTAVAAKADIVAGKVPSNQLPSFVDDVLEFADEAAFPVTGEQGKIYLAINSPPTTPTKQFRWSGSAYTEITSSPGSTDAVPEGGTNLYFTAARARAAQFLASVAAPGLMKPGSGMTADPDGTVHVVAAGGGSGLPAYGDVYPTISSNGQTLLTVSGGYTAGLIDVLLNGVLLEYDDYTATNGTTITLVAGVNTTDVVRVRRWAYIPESMAVAKPGDTMTGALNWATPVSLASASSVAIGVAASNRITITGTTAITSFGTIAAGAVRTVTFAGALVLTHNATSLILPGGANITTAAGDTAEFESLGGGNWRCTAFQRAAGLPVLLAGAQTVAGAKTFSDISFSDTAFKSYVATTLAITLYDTAGSQSDYSYYDRTNNKYGWTVNSVDRMTLSSAGALVCSGDVSGTSDERLKTAWAPLAPDFSTRLADVKHGSYTRTDTLVRQVGVSAQSLRELLPEAVHEDEHGMLSVAYGQAALVACVELAREVMALRAEVAALRGA